MKTLKEKDLFRVTGKRNGLNDIAKIKAYSKKQARLLALKLNGFQYVEHTVKIS